MKLLLGMLAVLLAACSDTQAQQAEVPPIRNFFKINQDYCTGGQPRLEHLEKLKAEGVKAIINLRPPSEHRAGEEEAKAKENWGCGTSTSPSCTLTRSRNRLMNF
jgi:hypothetical protein